MQLIGLATVVLFLAALASFLVAFYNNDWARTGITIGFLLLAFAALLLTVTIKKRNKTERI